MDAETKNKYDRYGKIIKILKIFIAIMLVVFIYCSYLLINTYV